MTGKDLLAQLLDIQRTNPNDLDLKVVHVHTESSSSEDSCGYEVEEEIEGIRVSGTGRDWKPVLKIGY